MCHSVTHDRRDAPLPLGRPGPRRSPPRRRPAAWSRWSSASTTARAVEAPALPPPAIDAGAARRARGGRRRRARAHRRRDPPAAHPRQVDARPAPRPVRRPHRRTRRRRPARRRTTRSPPSWRWAVEHHVAVVPVRRRHLGDRRPGRRAATGTPGWSRLDLVRMKRLVAVDHVSMTAVLEPGLRGPEAEALLAAEGLTARPLPAVLRVRHDRRLRRHPLQRPVERRLRPLRRARRRPHASPPRAARIDLGQRAGQRRRPRPAPALPRLRGHVRRDHRGHRPGAAGCPRRRSTRAGGGRRSPPAPPRCAPSPRRGCCRPCSGSPTSPRPRSTSPDPDAIGGEGGRRLPDDHRLRGRARPRSRPSGRRSPPC